MLHPLLRTHLPQQLLYPLVGRHFTTKLVGKCGKEANLPRDEGCAETVTGEETKSTPGYSKGEESV